MQITKQLSRAESILKRAKQHQLHSTPDKNHQSEQRNFSTVSRSPIQLARYWGRTIWSTEQALKFFDKVTAVLRLHSCDGKRSGGDNKVKTLKGDYIKIETLDKHYRPFYQELKEWPSLNLWCHADQSPFETKNDSNVLHEDQSKLRKFSRIDSRTICTTKSTKTVGTTMTRKSRPQGGGCGGATTTNNKINNQKSRSGSDKQCGYCEICHVEYDVLKVHLKSDEHMNFVKNDDNFKSLDKLIECRANCKQFLSSETKVKPLMNGMKTNHLSSESAESDSETCENSLNGDIHRNAKTVNNLSNKMKRKCTQQLAPVHSKRSLSDQRKGVNSKMVQATRIRGLRWCAPSPESRPPVKEPPVYKVENNKDSEPSDTTTTTTTLNNKKINSEKIQVVVKLKRVRQSELNLLNNEAEQFMFPKTPTYSDSDTDEERNSSEPNKSKNISFDISSSPNVKDSAGNTKRTQVNRRNTKQVQAGAKTKRQGKQLKHVERYGDSPSKSRFPETPIQPVPLTDTSLWGPDDRMGDRLLKSPGGTVQSRWLNFRKKYQSIENEIKFNFERVPHNEPWYTTFLRQNMGQEYGYEYFGNSMYHKLPYEMGSLPPAKEDCCKLNQFVLPKQGKNSQTPRKRGGCQAYPRHPSIAKVTDRTRSSTAAIIEATKAVDLQDDTTNDSTRALPLKKRKLLLEEFPRKSPREHPSTLAILSSLTNQSSLASCSYNNTINNSTVSRRYRDRLSSQLSIEDEDSNSTMTSQQTSKTEKESVISALQNVSINYFNINKLSRNIDEMLESAHNDDGDTEISLNDQLSIDGNESVPIFNDNTNDFDLLKVMDECADEELTLKSVKCKEKEMQRRVTYSTTPKLITSGFRFNKKRRNNRTGFPIIRRKPSIQKDPKDPNLTTRVGLKNEVTTTPDMFAVSSDSQEDSTLENSKILNNTNNIDADKSQQEQAAPNRDNTEEQNTEEDNNVSKRLTTPKSPQPKLNSYNRGRYQFEKYPKISLTPVAGSNMKTRSSDLQKRKSITPKKYSDTQSVRSPMSSPNKYSPRKLRKPRGCWYKER